MVMMIAVMAAGIRYDDVLRAFMLVPMSPAAHAEVGRL
jgi:hypothetical protein